MGDQKPPLAPPAQDKPLEGEIVPCTDGTQAQSGQAMVTPAGAPPVIVATAPATPSAPVNVQQGLQFNLIQPNAQQQLTAIATPENIADAIKVFDAQDARRADVAKEKLKYFLQKGRQRNSMITFGVLIGAVAAIWLATIGQGALVGELLRYLATLVAGVVGGYGLGTRKKDEKGE
jgi:hypothetical protein